ncbi:MAG: 5-(carboxyamino)imidazole ribonucleotide synthase [Chitinophagaceae bacterium]|nr:5-(carboxyamino)imidazole ribonucleotide synthase [Chitinophagaceae bacterium]
MQYIQPDRIKIGVLGGGQLGRMMIQSAINLNLPVCCLDPDPNAPCKHIATEFAVGNLNDFDTVYAFGQDKDVITIEIENVNVAALKKLQSEGKKVFPQPEVIELIKDKGLQKLFYKEHDIPSPEFFLIDAKEEIAQYAGSFPFFQKMRTGGYDGKGVVKLSDPQNLGMAFDVPSVLETLIDFDKEISVIVARNAGGSLSCFPAVECAFNPEANLVEFLFSPATIDAGIEKQAIDIAKTIAEKLGIVGILAVEMFVTKSGQVLVNEIAPRPHNSGHHTIEGNITSQFEQHIRAILDLPLGDTAIVRPAVMINLLGEKGYEGAARYTGLSEALEQSGVYVHLYGKAITKPFRKMGHITVTDKELSKATEKARALKETVKIIS